MQRLLRNNNVIFTATSSFIHLNSSHYLQIICFVIQIKIIADVKFGKYRPYSPSEPLKLEGVGLGVDVGV